MLTFNMLNLLCTKRRLIESMFVFIIILSKTSWSVKCLKMLLFLGIFLDQIKRFHYFLNIFNQILILPGEAGIPSMSRQSLAYSSAASSPVLVCKAWSTLARTICLKLNSPNKQ